VITPLIDNNTIDVKGLENLIEHLVTGGVHGLFILGTTGEATSLSCKLRKEFIRRTCDLGESPDSHHGWNYGYIV